MKIKLYDFVVKDASKNVVLEYKNISYEYIDKFLNAYYNNTFLKYAYNYEIKEVSK